MAQPSNENKGTSPYVRYKKIPFKYSDELMNWTAAVKKGDKAAADRHDRAWKKKFAPDALYRPRRDESEFHFMLDDGVMEEHYASQR